MAQRLAGRRLKSILLVLGCLAFIAMAPLFGQSLDGPRGAFIFWVLRVPRVLVAAMVGGILALAGAVFQALFQNPLATPSTVGTLAGATLGALLGLLIQASFNLGSLPIVTAFAFGGALVVSLLVAAIAAQKRATMHDVLLAGIAMTLAATAISTGLQYASDMSTIFAATQWSLGHLSQVGYQGVILILPVFVITAVVLLSFIRALEAVALGEELAQTQGVNVRRLRMMSLVCASFGVAVCVAWCGPIAFTGLIVPNVARLLVGASQRMVLPTSLLGGATFLVACDTLARLLLPGRELPVGVVTAVLGAPAIMFLIRYRTTSQ